MSQLTEPAAAAPHTPTKRIVAPPSPAHAGSLKPPVLTVRVGVTGHRDLSGADSDGLRRAIDGVLQLVEDAVREVADTPGAGYAVGDPCLAAVSPLADGADRVFAASALARGWELHVPMPFPQADYEQDFTPESREEFRALRDRAARVLELDGSRTRSELAYLRAGQITLHQCEVLVAVWNGRAASHIGGTAQIVDEAYGRGIPVVWIHSAAPHRVTLLSAPPDEDPAGIPLVPALPDRLREMLLPPPPERGGRSWHGRLREALGGPTGRLGPDTYYRPLSARVWHVPFFRWFRSAVLMGARLPKPASTSPPPPWPDFHWADRRANHHAQAYRSAFTATYLLGALAVFCALLYGYAHPTGVQRSESLDPILAVWAELAFTLLATTIVGLAWWGRWHDLWLDARLLAERFRQLDILQRLGRSAPGTRAQSVPFAAAPAAEVNPVELDAGAGARPDELWATWLFRAHARAIGMPAARFDGEYLQAYRAHLRKVLDGQREYHHANHTVLHRLRERLHLFGLLFFLGTLTICLIHLFKVHISGATFWFIVSAGTLPAFAAAIAGIIGHGEFQRIARNSGETARRLDALVASLNKLENPTSREFGWIAENASELMLGELLAWHLLISERQIQVGH